MCSHRSDLGPLRVAITSSHPGHIGACASTTPFIDPALCSSSLRQSSGLTSGISCHLLAPFAVASKQACGSTILEWLPASEKRCNVGIAECAEAVAASLAAITSEAHRSKPTLMGHSLGGTLAAICAAIAPATIGGLVLLGSPLCFRPDESTFRDALVSLVPEPVSDLEPYPGSILSHASAAASPETFVWSRLMDAFLSMADGGAANIYARVERWAFDEVALPGKLVREIVESLYRENQFCRGMLKVRQQIVGPENLSAPTLAVVNTADVVAPLHSVSLIGEALGPEKFHIIEYPGETGVCLQHLGILVGRHAHARVWPQIIEWIMLQYERGSKLRG